MLSIKVLGTGCANCERLEQNARLALEQVRVQTPEIDCEVEKVSDIAEMMKYGLLSPPGLVVDGQLVSKGAIPDPDTIAGWIRAAAGNPAAGLSAS